MAAAILNVSIRRNLFYGFTHWRAQFIFCPMFLDRDGFDSLLKHAILALSLVMLVFAPLAFGAVDEWAFLIVEGGAAIVFVLWCARLWVNPKLNVLWPPLTWVVMAFALYAVARYFMADIEYVARLEVIQVVLFALFFLVVINNLHGQSDSQVISFALIILATGISGYAVLQLVTHSTYVWNVHSPYLYQHRAGGTYISPNDLAGFLEMLLPLALAYLLAGRIKVIPRILLGYAILMMLCGLAVTFSRAGWIAAGIGILFVPGILLFHRNHRIPAILVLAVLLGGGWFGVSKVLSKTKGFSERVVQTSEDAPSALNALSRLAIWQSAEWMWQDNFWLGVGPGHFDFRFPEYRQEVSQGRPGHVHNDYLNLLVDWGAVGGIIVLVGISIFVFSLIKKWPHVRRQENDFKRGYSDRFAFFLGATGGLLALAVHSAVDFNLHIPANALIAVTLLALLTSNLRFATESYWIRGSLPLKLVLTLGLLAVVFAFGMDEWRRGHEAMWLSRADKKQLFSAERAELLQKAFVWEPNNFQNAYNIGECFWMPAFQGAENDEALAKEALEWYARARKLDPYDAYGYLRAGMCMDLLGQHTDAGKFYNRAETLDPNGYYTVAYTGWHYVQTGDFSAARQYFIRSIKLSNAISDTNNMARTYVKICEKRLKMTASGKSLWP